MDDRFFSGIDRNNNFDLIRLLAALQVVIVHSIIHFSIVIPPLIERFFALFPGVPIFFFVSGLLITSSVVRSSSLKSYAIKRLKRVYPALWFFFAVALLILIIFRQVSFSSFALPSFWLWVLTQLSFFQLYNPAEFRDFGVGVVNGSLWTIPVEMSFYAALPMLLFLSKKTNNGFLNFQLILAVIGGLSFFAHIIVIFFADSEAFLTNLLRLSLVTHFWEFACGVFAYLYFDKLKLLLKNRVLIFLVIYLAIGFIGGSLVGSTLVRALSAPILFATIFGLGICTPAITAWLLRGWDISYGLYLVHMLVINFVIEASIADGMTALLVVSVSAIALAMISWKFIESPILRKKLR